MHIFKSWIRRDLPFEVVQIAKKGRLSGIVSSQSQNSSEKFSEWDITAQVSLSDITMKSRLDFISEICKSHSSFVSCF